MKEGRHTLEEKMSEVSLDPTKKEVQLSLYGGKVSSYIPRDSRHLSFHTCHGARHEDEVGVCLHAFYWVISMVKLVPSRSPE